MFKFWRTFPAIRYLPEVNNGKNRRCKSCPKLTIKTLERRDLVLVSLSLTLNRFNTIFFVSNYFEQVNASRVFNFLFTLMGRQGVIKAWENIRHN